MRIISLKMKSGAAGNLVSNDERKRRQEGKGIRKIADPAHSGRRGIWYPMMKGKGGRKEREYGR